MPNETSAGGVVVREHGGVLEVAVIRPRGKKIWALPKGHVDKGEEPDATALREVMEETGLRATLESPLGDIRYVYQWAGERIFKRVSFFLLRYQSGEIDAIEPEMRLEVEQARWIPLSDAPKELAYKGEREMAKKAMALLGKGSR